MGFLDKFLGKKPVATPIRSCADEVSAHFEALFPGRESFVFHDLISDSVHIDVNVMRPTPEQDFYVLYTTGMSDLPMTLPRKIAKREDLKYAELYLFLPGSWDLGKTGSLSSDIPEADYWPVGLLKFLAGFPHAYHTWLGFGHTLPNGADYEPFHDGVGFGGVILSRRDGGLAGLETSNGRHLALCGVIPAYKEEIAYKLEYGMEKLEDLFREKELSMILDIHRPNLCADLREGPNKCVFSGVDKSAANR